MGSRNGGVLHQSGGGAQATAARSVRADARRSSRSVACTPALCSTARTSSSQPHSPVSERRVRFDSRRLHHSTRSLRSLAHCALSDQSSGSSSKGTTLCFRYLCGRPGQRSLSPIPRQWQQELPHGITGRIGGRRWQSPPSRSGNRKRSASSRHASARLSHRTVVTAESLADPAWRTTLFVQTVTREGVAL